MERNEPVRISIIRPAMKLARVITKFEDVGISFERENGMNEAMEELLQVISEAWGLPEETLPEDVWVEDSNDKEEGGHFKDGEWINGVHYCSDWMYDRFYKCATNDDVDEFVDRILKVRKELTKQGWKLPELC